MNLKYITLFVIIFLFSITSYNAYAVNSIDWTWGGSIIDPSPFGVPIATISNGNILDLPINILVDATDESDFTSNDKIDTIDVVVSSVDDPNKIIYTLTETEINSGIFTGTNFVFLTGNYKFQITDVIKSTIFVDPEFSDCDTDNTITHLDGRNGGNEDGLKVFSNSDLDGVGFVLTETGDNTCTFEGQVKFTTSPSDESTGKLHVSEGDLLAFVDEYNFLIYSAQIIPETAGKGSIMAHSDILFDLSSAQVTATYNGLSKGLHLLNDGSEGAGVGGSGSGGPIVRPGLVLNFIAALLEGDRGGSTHSSPPTLGLDINQKRIVDDGFSFNGNAIDVEQYYTPYPLITTPVGQNNTIKLKIYEEDGLDNIAHVGLSYGLGKGETFNEGHATIEYDKTFDGKESVTKFDPNHVLGDVNVTTTNVRCGESSNAICREFTFYHVFRAPLEYNMVATNIWDFQRNGWQNYFNHGIHITGESMNPPKQYSGIYNGHIYHLTETGKNIAVDDQGNSWTMDKTWNRDYIKPNVADNDILNQQKITAIEKLGFGYSDGQAIFGFDRMDHRFADIKEQQKNEAQNLMKNLCTTCQKEQFDNINNIFSYNMPDRHSKLENSATTIKIESQRAEKFIKQYFGYIYPEKVND